MITCNLTREAADQWWTCNKCGRLVSPRFSVPPELPCNTTGVNNGLSPKKLLGDHIEEALTSVGITSDRVSKFLGRPCGCKERKEKLNRLHAWAIRVMGGHVEEGKKDIEEMLNE